MKMTEYTCDQCGEVVPLDGAGNWAHYTRGRGDKRVSKDFCSDACFGQWAANRAQQPPLFGAA